MALRAVPFPDESSLTVNLFDGTRNPFPDGIDVLYRVFDGNQKQIAEPERPVSSIAFTVPFYDNFGDNYRVIVFSDSYNQAGYTPVKLSPAAPVTWMTQPGEIATPMRWRTSPSPWRRCLTSLPR